MLEVLVSLRRDNNSISGKDTALKKTGDILVVKKSPAVWGKKEMEDFLIIFLKDDDLENSMESNVKVNPYAVYEEVETPEGVEFDMLTRSKYRVDISKFSDTESLDTTKEVGAVLLDGEVATLSDLILDEEERYDSII